MLLESAVTWGWSSEIGLFDDGTAEGSLAQKMQKDLVDKIPVVASECINFRQPIQHMIAEKNFTFSNDLFHHCLFDNKNICRLLDVGHDFDATDHEWNTLLLLVTKMIAWWRCSKHTALLHWSRHTYKQETLMEKVWEKSRISFIEK